VRALILAEHAEGTVSKAGLEAAGLALALAGTRGDCAFALLGKGAHEAARELAVTYGVPAVAVLGKGLFPPTSWAWARAVWDVFGHAPPEFFAAPQTTLMSEILPMLAARAGGFYASGVEDWHAGQDGPVFLRAAYSGKYAMETAPRVRPVFLTVLPGAFAPLAPVEGAEARVTEARAELPPSPVEHAGWSRPLESGLSLALADSLVAGGRGLGGPEGVDLLRQAAALFPRSAVAGSRGACDAGWLPASSQVGVTGATVSPKLYMACGISGAFQHVAGMRGAGFVVAVNLDPKAPVFLHADVGIVEDLKVFLPLLLKAAGENP
jgi:electron transfer flavoprotein alpha subunit